MSHSVAVGETILSAMASCSKPASVAQSVASRYALPGESGFEAQASRIIVSGYSSVCFEIKFSGRHRGFDGVQGPL